MPTRQRIRQRKAEEKCYVCYKARLFYMEKGGGTGGTALTNKQARTIEKLMEIRAVCICSDDIRCLDKLCAFYVKREEMDGA